MSERVGVCHFCAGTGQRWMPIPGAPLKETRVEATAEELRTLRELKTGAEKSPIIEVTRRFFVRECGMCMGTPGLSGAAEEIRRI